MKQKILFALLAVMCLVGCGSEEEDFEKFYADDDFVMTDRNIREKIIGTWVIDAQMTNGEWGEVKDSAVKANNLFTVRKDWSCDCYDFIDSKVRVSNDTIILSVYCLFIDNQHGGKSWGYLTNDFDMRTASKEASHAESVGCLASFIYDDFIRAKVRSMKKDEFIVDAFRTVIKKTERYRLRRN